MLTRIPKVSLLLILLLVSTRAQNLVHRHLPSIAVVEYEQITQPSFTTRDAQIKNAEKYIEIIDELSRKYHLILVIFPEATLDYFKSKQDLIDNGAEFKQHIVPCNQTNIPVFLKMLSCAAQKYHVTIVFNLIEKEAQRVYTSDALLNIDGTLEFSLKRENRIGTGALHNKPVAFAIPVRFIFSIVSGAFLRQPNFDFTPTSFVTGFSFSYEKIVNRNSKRNYVVCSNWISQLPFLTSLQVVQMWAQEFNITVFMSGANNPAKGQGGTAIYHREDGPILMEIGAKRGTKAYVYHFINNTSGALAESVEEKSVDELAKEMDNFYLEQDPDLDRYKSLVLRKKESFVYLCNDNVKDNYFCCSFDIKLSINTSVTNKKRYTYHLVAYKGYKTYHNIFRPGGIEVCAVIACLNSKLKSCGQRFKNYDEIGWPITFEKLVIKATFGMPRKEKIYYSSQFPNSLLSSIRPIHPDFTSWSSQIIFDAQNKSYLERTFALLEPQSKILTFGIFGRNFTLHDQRSKGQKLSFHPLGIVLSLIIINY
ncbi:Vanin-like protein 1 [Tribolium castaneum]|uniref:Vanin-like protein 1 n=1 Tax=Tribolium castaneum TaxID=7070 RepID=A0A139WGW2_TRICA|nr:Vanin-like protein 1 [Tribolium castaneum]